MNWTNSGRATLAGLMLLGSAQAQAVGTLYAGFGGSSDGISVRSATTLTETGVIAAGGEVSGVAAGVNDANDNIYVATSDIIFSYDVNGTVIASETVAGAGFNDVALLGAEIWVTAAGASNGISARDLNTLVESQFVDTTFTPTSIEDGFGRLYITAGESLYIFGGDGVQLVEVDSGTPGVTFVDSALSGTRLYAVTGGSQNGVSVRNPITLAEITSFALPFAVEGVVAGDDDDLFLTSGGNIFRYSTAGVELDSVVDGTAGRAFTDITFIADPLPPASGTALAITAVGAADSVSKRDAETLADAGSFDIAAAATGIALGASNDVFLAAGDTLYHYGTGGALLAQITNAGAVFADVALVDGNLVVANASGLSIRNPDTLVQIDSAALPFTASSVSAAGTGEVYLTSGNSVYRYSTAGTELASFSGDAGFTYSDVALVKSVVYATYNSTTADGISVLDPGSLGQSDIIPTSIAATGIATGGGNDYYISGGDSIFHYALDEVLSSFSAGTGTVFPDVVYSAEGSSSQTSVVAAILPSSRSVQVGNSASAFATVINTGPVTASNCRIEPSTTIPSTFSYQTTDPGTNELVGTADTPVDIASNGSQTFLFQFEPTAAFNSTEVALDFECTNAPAAPVFVGVNTLLLSADDNPVPDVVALASTPTTPGIVDIPGVGGTGFFAVASVNVGVSGDLAVTASMTDGDPNVALSICQTDPVTAACINPTAPTSGAVNVTVDANATPTFSIFAAASGDVPLDAAGKRIRVVFAEQTGGAVRGATSVAVRTQ